jgi:hypothetical protein
MLSNAGLTKSPPFDNPLFPIVSKRKMKKRMKYFKKTKKPFKNFLDDFFFSTNLTNVCMDNDRNLLRPGLLPKDPVSTRLFRFKSGKDLTSVKEVERLFAVPYVDDDGMISTAILGYWKTSPSNFLGSLTSTIYDRVCQKFRHKVSRKKFRRKDSFILQACLHYAITLNDYQFTRVLHCLYKDRKNARSLLYRYTCNMNPHFRFFHAMMCYNIKWLQSRGRSRPASKGFDFMNTRYFFSPRFHKMKTKTRKKCVQQFSEHWNFFHVREDSEHLNVKEEEFNSVQDQLSFLFFRRIQ